MNTQITIKKPSTASWQYLLLFAICLFLLPVTQAFAAIPEGFSDEVVVGGLDLPTTFDFAPDGRIFVAEKEGTVRVIKNGKLLETPFYTIPNINTHIDRGLIGLALDPDFESNGWVYLSHTYENNPDDIFGPKMAQIIRVRAVGDVADPSSVKVLVGTEVGDAERPSCNDFATGTDCIPSDSGSHSAGGLRFGPDGKLYATLGDGAGFSSVDPNAYKAQDLDWLTGKILRLNTDGTAPADNPFYTGDPTENRSKIYAYGIRNSFRFDFRESNGSLYTGEVGWGGAEEINVVEPGDNLGWPCREGYVAQGSYECTADGYDDPIYSYGPTDGAVAVTGGSFAGSAYPSEYQDTYFFGDFHRSDVYRMIVDENDEMVSLETWHDGTGNGPVSILSAPDGSIYYIAIFTGELRQFLHDSMRGDPVAPIANDDSAETLQNSGLVVNVTNNDTDLNRDDLTVTAVGTPENGTASIVDNDSVSYDPALDYIGSDSFTYSITDGTFTATATVLVTIKEGGDPTVVEPVHQSATRSIDVPVVGQNVTFTTNVFNEGGAGPALIYFVLHDDETEERITERILDNETLPGNSLSSFDFTWLPGRAGRYRLDVGYFEAGWGEMHAWFYDAMTFEVFDREPPAEPLTLEIDSVSVSNNTPEVGEAIDVDVTVTNTGRSGTGVVDTEIFDDAATMVGQEVFEDVSFAASETKTFSTTWTPTEEGTFWAEAGTFGAGWTPFMNWAWHAAEITVVEDSTGTTTGTTTQPTLTIDGVGVNDVKQYDAEVGEMVELSVTVTNTGDAGFGYIDLGLYSYITEGTQLEQFLFEDVSFAAGETKVLTTEWQTSFLEDENYFWLEAGAFGEDGAPFMDWEWHGAEITVLEDTGTSTGGGAVTIYEDTLGSNWANWSWDTTADFAYTGDPVTDGTAIAVEHQTGWAGFFLRAATAVPLTDLSELAFEIAGAGTGGQTVQVVIMDDTDTVIAETQLSPLSDTWETVNVDLSAFADSSVLNIFVQDVSGEAGTSYYLDNVRFE